VLLSQFTGIGYDGLNRITGYTSNIAGLNSGARDWSGEYEFLYNERGELASESLDTDGGDPDHGYTRTYTYDGAGNRLTGGLDYNDNNQLDLEDYAYNAGGNPTEYDGINLEFNGDDRLSEYGPTLICGYRGDGLHAWKDSGAGRTYYLYDGGTLLAELDAAGALTDVNL